MARKIYLKNKEQSDLQGILRAFEECTGLSLSDIERAFVKEIGKTLQVAILMVDRSGP